MHLLELNRLAALGDQKASATRTLRSRKIWKDCPYWELERGLKDGFTYFNDFTVGVNALANNQTTTYLGNGVSGWTGATAGSTITTSAAYPGGLLVLSSTTDNEGAGIMALGGGNASGQVIFGTGKRVWMEAAIKTVNITDSKYNLFLGFAEEALNASGGIISTSDAITDKDLIGFQRVFADGDKMDVIHNTASGGGVTTAGADAATIVADTITKLGLYSDGTDIFFYQDNTLIDTVAVSATNVPDGEELAFYFQMMLGHGDDATASIDWVAIAQELAA